MKLSNKDETMDWLVTQVARLLEVDESQVNVNEPLVNYGLSSSHAVRVSGELAEKLGRTLEPTLLWDYPSIGEIVEYLFESQ